MAIDLNTFSKIVTHSEDSRLILSNAGQDVRASQPLGQSKAVTWLKSAIVPEATKLQQNRDVRAAFAEALKERFGAVIGEGVAASVLQKGDKPLTKREITVAIETANGEFDAFKLSITAKREHISGKSEQGRAELELDFNKIAERLDVRIGDRQLTFDDINTSSISEQINKKLGGINISSEKMTVIDEGKKKFAMGDSLRSDVISEFLLTKKAALAEIRVEDPSLRSALQEVVLNDPTIGPHDVRILIRSVEQMSSSLDEILNNKTDLKKAAGFLAELQVRTRQSIGDYVNELPTEAQKSIRVNDESILLGTMQIVAKTSTRHEDLKDFLGSKDMLAISEFAHTFGMADLQDFGKIAGNYDPNDNSFRLASDLSKMHGALKRAVDTAKSLENVKTDEQPAYKTGVDKNELSVESRPSLNDFDSDIVEITLQAIKGDWLLKDPTTN